MLDRAQIYLILSVVSVLLIAGVIYFLLPEGETQPAPEKETREPNRGEQECEQTEQSQIRQTEIEQSNSNSRPPTEDELLKGVTNGIDDNNPEKRERGVQDAGNIQINYDISYENELGTKDNPSRFAAGGNDRKSHTRQRNVGVPERPLPDKVLPCDNVEMFMGDFY